MVPKSLPEGGWYSLPKLNAPGALIVGDSAGFLNGQRLKGIHLAMKSGMVAADTIYSGLINDDLDNQLNNFEQNIKNSWIYPELYKARNFHQAFDKGLFAGMYNAGIGLFTGGRGWGFKNKLNSKSGHKHLDPKSVIDNSKYKNLKFDGKYLFDKVTNVYRSSTSHNEDQVPHLHIQNTNVCIDKCEKNLEIPVKSFALLMFIISLKKMSKKRCI